MFFCSGIHGILEVVECTVGQNNQEYRLEYWATRLSVRSFARTTREKVFDRMAIYSVFSSILSPSARMSPIVHAWLKKIRSCSLPSPSLLRMWYQAGSPAQDPLWLKVSVLPFFAAMHASYLNRHSLVWVLPSESHTGLNRKGHPGLQTAVGIKTKIGFYVNHSKSC